MVKIAMWHFILDITEKKEAEQKIYFHANHDQLTGLTNRFYFKEYLHASCYHLCRIKMMRILT